MFLYYHLIRFLEEVQRIPNEAVNYNQEQIIDIEKMLDKIDYDDDVQNVFTNIL